MEMKRENEKENKGTRYWVAMASHATKSRDGDQCSSMSVACQ